MNAWPERTREYRSYIFDSRTWDRVEETPLRVEPGERVVVEDGLADVGFAAAAWLEVSPAWRGRRRSMVADGPGVYTRQLRALLQ